MPHVFIKKSNVRANKRSSLKRPAHVSRITYRLVAKQDVDIRHDLHQGLFKELADERRWEVHAEDLVAIRGMLRHLHDRLGGHGQEKTLGTRTGFIYIMCVRSWVDLSWSRQTNMLDSIWQTALSYSWQCSTSTNTLECRFLCT